MSSPSRTSERSAEFDGRVASPGRSPRLLSPTLAAQQVQDTGSLNPAAGAITTRDTTTALPPRRRRVVTDVVLLPCSTQNPRPDGSFSIPPHNPWHRTIVGLPSAPGEPKRGFIIPPHDPGRENRVPIRVISMDSILEPWLQVPPHDPNQSNIVRPYAVPCVADSTGQ